MALPGDLSQEEELESVNMFYHLLDNFPDSFKHLLFIKALQVQGPSALKGWEAERDAILYTCIRQNPEVLGMLVQAVEGGIEGEDEDGGLGVEGEDEDEDEEDADDDFPAEDGDAEASVHPAFRGLYAADNGPQLVSREDNQRLLQFARQHRTMAEPESDESGNAVTQEYAGYRKIAAERHDFDSSTRAPDAVEYQEEELETYAKTCFGPSPGLPPPRLPGGHQPSTFSPAFLASAMRTTQPSGSNATTVPPASIPPVADDNTIKSFLDALLAPTSAPSSAAGAVEHNAIQVESADTSLSSEEYVRKRQEAREMYQRILEGSGIALDMEPDDNY